MKRQARQLRRETRRTQRYELHVFTEGEVTEVQYLKNLERRHRHCVVVTVDQFHGGPLQLVQHAVEARLHDLKVEKKGGGRARDEYWCVFDTDEHPNIDEAIQLAQHNDVWVAISNPCIELWFVLHHEDQTAYLNRREAQKAWSEICGNNTKAVDQQVVEELMARFDGARHRAEQLDRKHHLDDSPPRSNPSSSLWRLVQTVLDHS